MDPTTAIMILAAHLLCSGGLLLMISRSMPPRSGPLAWAAAFGLFGGSYLLRLLTGLQSNAPFTVLMDTGMVAATLLFGHGMRQFIGQNLVSLRAAWLTLGLFVPLELAGVLLHGNMGRYTVLNFWLGAMYLWLAGTALSALRLARGDVARSTDRASPAQPPISEIAHPALQRPLRVAATLTGILAVLTLGRGLHIASSGADVAYTSTYAQMYYGYSSIYALLLAMTLQWMVFVRLNGQLADLATRDPLTRTLNRTGLEEALVRHFGVRGALPVTLLAIDVDHFKQVNDRHGHATGDRVLRALAAVLSRHVRPSDLVARVGGEEFLVVCAAADPQAAHDLAERLRVATRDLVLDLNGSEERCTISIGVSAPCERLTEIEASAAAADSALYAAKAAGRDRVAAAAA